MNQVRLQPVNLMYGYIGLQRITHIQWYCISILKVEVAYILRNSLRDVLEHTYVGYKKLENVTLCGCLVHAKRKFHKALIVSPDNEIAKTGEKYLCKLFALEHDADKQGMSLEERYALRLT